MRCLMCWGHHISILFSLFQSSFVSSLTGSGSVLFPYYLVYFKANLLWLEKKRKKKISILFSLFQSLLLVMWLVEAIILFPYYLVYFKAWIHSRNRPWYTKFPYYLVYFKAVQKVDRIKIFKAGFPYYLVYFKALKIFFSLLQFIQISILFSLFQSVIWWLGWWWKAFISILFSLFQSLTSPASKDLAMSYFHTI